MTGGGEGGGDPDVAAEAQYRLIERIVSSEERLKTELLKGQRLEAIGRLAGGLAHDFNNFLTIIVGNLNVAQNKIEQGESIEEELEIAVKACTHASGVTSQMLTFSKGGAPVTALASIETIVRESAQITLRGKKTRVVWGRMDSMRSVEVDRAQMHQVFSNLMLNADQAMPKGGDLRIELRKGTNAITAAPSAVIELTDQGVGIPKDDIDRIFEPYFTTRSEGSGLGLTSAYWIIQRHGGVLELESEPGVGTAVRVVLPFGEGTMVHAADNGVSAPASRTARVLIMDDNELVRGVLRAMLEALGHEVVDAVDGSACVLAFQEGLENGRPIELVILDLTVPGGRGGVWAFEHLREIDPHVQAIVASGYGTDAVLAAPGAFGFQGRLQKPFEIEDLRKVVDGVLAGGPGEAR